LGRARLTFQLAGIGCAIVWLASCKMSPDEQYVSEKVPIEIDQDKPVVVEIRSLSGNGWNDVGIRCSPEIWDALSAAGGNVSVRLVSSGQGATKLIDVSPGGHKLWPINSFYYLFAIDGRRGTSAKVEIAFPASRLRATHVEFLVLKTPADTGL